jgi:hypothetical protein
MTATSTAARASAAEPTFGLAYAIYGERQGRWRLDSLFDDRDLALFESQHLAGSRHYSAVKLEKRDHGAADNPIPTTIYQSGGATAAKVAPLRPARAIRHRSGRAKVLALVGLALFAVALALVLGITP